ncbi:hypothetical protein RHGRI_033919 [Rhododendron griersonianum]|uniref:Uncharacterized protein n=1 Tax=Rhododendron griersonianum TaxID=479676 RepID=A0AAV6HYK1_9ERIC|nr:hypothetical protein RHGRI_033919 [Rhododendron griersonianum]KAG5521517.1 hypothetical protein RHGRI_033919 [Rhododendron griersonianum]
MSTGSDLALIGAPLKVLISFASVFFALCMRQLCSLHLFSSAFSMPLRPKRGFLFLLGFLWMQDLYWSKVFSRFSHKAICPSILVLERASYLIYNSGFA